MDSEPAHTTSTGEPLGQVDRALTKKENVLPNGSAYEQERPTEKVATPVDSATTQSPLAKFDDGKIVVNDEPPPIQAVRAAPGMSATSGPLEDFPEGGDMH